MVIVTGSVLAKPGQLDALVALSLEHVRRSRGEPGCLTHAVHVDAENPDHLVFFEEWSDKAALMVHFTIPASRAFAEAVGRLAAAPPVVTIYEVNQLPMTL